jgi:hypothetical protein
VSGTFTGAAAIAPPRNSPEQAEGDWSEWVEEIQAVEEAVSRLLAAKRATMARSYQAEHILWVRHYPVLRHCKRLLDAVVM